MPSRRRTRRALSRPSTQRFSRSKTIRRRRKLTKSSKPRLVRRYIRRKQEQESSHAKHTKFDSDKAGKNPNQNVSGKRPGFDHHIANEKKAPSSHILLDEVTAVPNPIPDTGMMSTGVGAGSPLLGAFTDAETSWLLTPTMTLDAYKTSRISQSTSLAILFLSAHEISRPSLVLNREPYSTSGAEIASASETMDSALDNTTTRDAPSPHPPNVVVIVLLAVGTALVLLGTCIAVKVCCKPRHPERLRPSLPILKDGAPDDDFFESKESPLFGGKERFSPMPGIGTAWNWVQYKPSALTDNATQSRSSDAIRSKEPISELSNAPVGLRKPIQAVAPSLTKRESLASVYSPRLFNKIGQAISTEKEESSHIIDAHGAFKRSRRSLPKRISRSDQPSRNRESVISIGLAYDGDQAASPEITDFGQVEQTSGASTYERREKIRSGYFAAGTYPRISTMPSATYSIATATRINVGQRNSFNKEKIAVQRSNSKRQRDTQALTYALGLATPETKYVPRSPEPTLYPDDSMSVVESRQPKFIRRDKDAVESIPDVPIIVPIENPTSTLMNMDFGVSQMSLSALTMSPIPSNGYISRETDAGRGQESHPAVGLPFLAKHGDKAPRVPSPPPMPSLAQMAMSQHNAEAYANYRSPTYSLYGLYESTDSKSLVR